MLNLRFILSIFLVVIMVQGAGMVSGQAYPNKPIRILAGVAGGNNDVLSRILSQGISEPLGQPLIVENRPGGYATETVAKADPGALNYSLGGPGTAVHLAAELFKSMAGVQIVGIPYKGGGPISINAVIAGECQLSFPTAAAATSFLKAGKLRALAITKVIKDAGIREE